MSRFVIGVLDDCKEECVSSILYENMNIYHLMVHAQKEQETRAKIRSRDAKRASPFDGGSSKSRLYIQDKLKSKKMSSNNVPTKFPKARDDSVSNP